MTIPVRRDGEARDALIAITHTHMTIPVRRAREARGALIVITPMTIPRKIPLRGPLREHYSPHLSLCQHPYPRNTFHPFTPPVPSVSPNKRRPLDNRKTKKMIKNLHGSRKSRTFASAIIKIVIFTK